MELDTFRIAEVQKSARKLSHGLELQVEMKVAFSYLVSCGKLGLKMPFMTNDGIIFHRL